MYRSIFRFVLDRRIRLKVERVIHLLSFIKKKKNVTNMLITLFLLFKCMVSLAFGAGFFFLFFTNEREKIVFVLFFLNLISKLIAGSLEYKNTFVFPFEKLRKISLAKERKIFRSLLASSYVYDLCHDEIMIIYIFIIMHITDNWFREEMNMGTCLEVKDLYYSYEKKKEILKGVSIKIEKEGIFILEGENGSGKSTFLKILASLLKESKGKVEYNGKSPMEDSYKERMGYIPDTPLLFDEPTEKEHITLFLDMWEIKGEAKKLYLEKVKKYIEMFEIKSYINDKVEVYSLGTKYKLYYILTMARELDLVLLDEPFHSLDENLYKKGIQLLNQIAQKATVIVSSHQKELIQDLQGEQYILVQGKIIKKE